MRIVFDVKYDDVSSSKRRPVNLSLMTEDTLRVAIKTERERRWKHESRDWIAAHNAWIDENGIPLSGLETL
jgi:antitoxin CcdA